MTSETFEVNGEKKQGYLALPASGSGPGVLLLHAWWGLTSVFTETADRLAAEGFVVFAPDLYEGKHTAEIAEAEKLVEAEGAFEGRMATTLAALAFLQNHPARTGDKVAAMGFSMGAAYALIVDEAQPDAFDKIVLFYGMAGANVGKSNAKILAHFAESDPYESTEEARKMSAPNLELHIYTGTGHWFFEHNRPDSYNVEAAGKAWECTISFLKA